MICMFYRRACLQLICHKPKLGLGLLPCVGGGLPLESFLGSVSRCGLYIWSFLIITTGPRLQGYWRISSEKLNLFLSARVGPFHSLFWEVCILYLHLQSLSKIEIILFLYFFIIPDTLYIDFNNLRQDYYQGIDIICDVVTEFRMPRSSQLACLL